MGNDMLLYEDPKIHVPCDRESPFGGPENLNTCAANAFNPFVR